ncbi:hypothetical protein GCM10022206_23130 [Streptomyces chiangmaiensis]
MPRSGLAGAITGYPSFCNRAITPFQLEASAKPPCTSTTVGLGGRGWRSPPDADADGVKVANAAAPARVHAAAPSANLRRLCGDFTMALLM